jgi:hypothetical protein
MVNVGLEHTPQTLTDVGQTLRTAYQDGKLDEVLSVLSGSLPGFHNLAAWCHYRQKEFAKCLEQVEISERYGESQSTLAIRAYLYAYAPEYKDEAKLTEIIPRLHPENVDGINAVVIAARAPDSTIPYQEVSRKAAETLGSLDYGQPSVSHANLLHNMARLSLEKGDFAQSLKFIDGALTAYGTETNFHHRGAANYWKSVIYERSGDFASAYSAAQDSLSVWQQQLDMAPENEEWKKRVAGAVARERELALKR